MARVKLLSDDFFRPPYRSWPHPPTELERLALRHRIDDEEYRALIYDAIQARLRHRGESWDALDRTLRMRENGH